MNYYSIFTGALFVGFCSLITAATKIEECCENTINQCRCCCCCSVEEAKCKVYTLTNDYSPLIIALCVMGLISSICWLLSLCGHEKWEYNWMKNIEYFEDKGSNDRAENDKSYKSFELYKVINGDKSEFKAFSTHTITKIFIIFVIIGWMFCLAQAICENNNCVSVSCCFIFSILVFVLLMAIIFCCNSSLYSAVNTKISRM